MAPHRQPDDLPTSGTAARLIARARSKSQCKSQAAQGTGATGTTDTGTTDTRAAATGATKAASTSGTRAASRAPSRPGGGSTGSVASAREPRSVQSRTGALASGELNRWLEPATYGTAAVAVVQRANGVRRRRRDALARLTRGKRIWAHTRLTGLVGLAVFVVAPALLFALGYLIFSVPIPDETVSKQVVTISYADETELARIVPEEGNRTKVTLDQVPKAVQFAVLAAEDRSFFSNPGFDPVGIARAAWRQLTGGVGGGSTITQQYVKKTLVGDAPSLWRKYKEMIIAVKISQQNRKDDILTDYLNAIYFGRGAYGIQSASQAYFGKNVGDLSTAEGALLAGVIQSPSGNDPAISPQRAAQRWTFVMEGMLRQGWITPDERARARFPATQPRPKATGGSPTDYRGLILNAIRDELDQKSINEQEFNQEGLKITTTIDPGLQQQAVESARKALIGQPPNLRGALVSIDPENGAIRAYYGGDNGTGLDYAKVSKQPGSTFKPFVLLAALEQDDPIGLGTRFKGMPIPGLRNSDGADCQVCDLKQATTISNNVIFRELALRVGPQKVADAARQAGITSPLTDVNEGIALGNKEVNPVELASAYATFAAGGTYHPPHLVTRVTTSDDRVIYEAVNTTEQRFSAQVARNVTEAMLGVPVNDELSLNGGRASAAKTGTVQSRIEGENNDAWIAGYTPSMATAVWIGTDQNSPIRNSRGTPITGAALPGTIWKTFMNDATKSQPEQSFGAFKAIGAPPTVTGPTDGLAAGPTTPPPPPPDIFAPPEFDLPQPSSRGSGIGRECDPFGCHTGQERDSATPDRGESGYRAPRAQSGGDEGSSEASGTVPTAREPVRG